MGRVETSLGAIGVSEQGAGGIPLVLLHGVGSDKSAWAPQLAHFGRTRRTVALDYPGYGESDPVSDGEGYPHDRFADAVLAALDTLDIPRAHLCGLSLGGVVAIAIAHRAPERIGSLILADTFAVHPEGAAILERSIAASSDMAAMSRSRVPALLAEPGAELADALVEVMARIDPAAFRMGAAAVWPADQQKRAAAIVAPTLVLCGAEDRITPPLLSAELTALIPSARLVLIEGAGHLPNLEQPTAFNAAIDSFLAQLAQA
ncbi:MAG: alpha/beta fold hydrolase [Sphingomicrobium sp.]|nr:alpha/beta fold hydrolase [Sphingomonadales bacterium]